MKKHPARRVPASLLIAWGYTWALNDVEAALNDIEDECLTMDQAQLRNSLHDFLNKLRPDDDSLKLKPTNRQLSEKYAVSPRTVTNWRKDDCPFDDGQWRVLDWMAERRYVPARAKAKFVRQLGRRTGEGLEGIEALRFRQKELSQMIRALRL